MKISTNSLESLRTEVTGTQESYRYLQAQFSHRSQGALGKYSSLQLTLKTIAQTTALRQKEVNYFHGCYVILVAVLPTFIFSTSGKVDKFHKAFDSFFFSPKANYEQAYPPVRVPSLRQFYSFPVGRRGDVTLVYKRL